MPQLQAMIESVVSKETAKGPIYKATIQGVEYSTFDRDLATKARDSIGQLALVDFEIKQNGQWTNHYLNGVTLPVGQASFGPSPTGVTNGGGFQPSPEFTQAPVAPDKETRILREVALKCAIATLPYFEPAEQTRTTIIALCNEYQAYFESGWADPRQAAVPATDDIPF